MLTARASAVVLGWLDQWIELVGNCKCGVRKVRGSYSGNTLAFQAKARSSILLPRSTVDIFEGSEFAHLAQW